MPRMGRPRSRHKDLPPGLFEARRRWYWRATNEASRQVLATLAPGKSSTPAGATKEDARRWWVREIVPRLDAAAPLETQPGTVAEILDNYVREVIPEFTSESGRDGATRYVAALRKAFGARRYAKTEAQAMSGGDGYLRDVDVTRYLYQNRERPAIANREIRTLAKAFVLARRRWGLTMYNPAIQAEYHTETPRDVYVDDAQFLAIRQHASPALQCMMDIAQMLGPRKGMIFDIRLGDIEFDPEPDPDGDSVGTLWLRPNKRRSKAPAKREPAVITPDMGTVLRRAIELRKATRGGGSVMADLPSAHLFLTRAGKPYGKSAFARIWKTARDAAGIKAREITFHDLRAKAGSDAASEADAQRLLGHKDAATTSRVYRRKRHPKVPLPKVAGE